MWLASETNTSIYTRSGWRGFSSQTIQVKSNNTGDDSSVRFNLNNNNDNDNNNNNDNDNDNNNNNDNDNDFLTKWNDSDKK